MQLLGKYIYRKKIGSLIAKYRFSGKNENKFNRYMKRKKKELIPQPKMIERFSPGLVFLINRDLMDLLVLPLPILGCRL